MKRAIVLVDQAIKRQGLCSQLVLTVHDELLLEVAPGEGKSMLELVSGRMIDAGEGLTVPLEVNMLEGRTWAEASKGGKSLFHGSG